MNSFQKLAYEIQRGQMLRKIAEEGLPPELSGALTGGLGALAVPGGPLVGPVVDAAFAPEGRELSRLGFGLGGAIGGAGIAAAVPGWSRGLMAIGAGLGAYGGALASRNYDKD